MRDIAKKYLPDSIYNNRRKFGYNASIESLVDFSDKNKEYILDKKSKIYDYIDYEKFLIFFTNRKNKDFQIIYQSFYFHLSVQKFFNSFN